MFKSFVEIKFEILSVLEFNFYETFQHSFMNLSVTNAEAFDGEFHFKNQNFLELFLNRSLLYPLHRDSWNIQ